MPKDIKDPKNKTHCVCFSEPPHSLPLDASAPPPHQLIILFNFSFQKKYKCPRICKDSTERYHVSFTQIPPMVTADVILAQYQNQDADTVWQCLLNTMSSNYMCGFMYQLCSPGAKFFPPLQGLPHTTPSSTSLSLANPPSISIVYNFIISVVSYKWKQTVCDFFEICFPTPSST
jgi:hypothetical protein